MTKRPQRTAAKPAPRAEFNPDAPTGAAIARLRAGAGLTEAQFAKALGVSVASVQRWEGYPGALRIQARPLAALTGLRDQLAGGKKPASPSGKRGKR